MPSGPKKRKAAKKKQVKHSDHSNSSSTTHSRHGESDGGVLSSPAAQDQHNHQHPFTEGEVVEVEKREDNSSQTKSITIVSTEKAGEEDEGNIEIDKGPKSRKSHDGSSCSSTSGSDDESHVFEKKVVVLESAPVVEVLESAPVVELVQPIETFPEKITHKVEDLAVEASSVLDPVNPAGSLLKTVSHEYDDPKIEEKKYLAVEETPLVSEFDKNSFLEQKLVVNGSASKDNCSTSSVVDESVLEENGAEKLPLSDENALSASKDNAAASTHPTGLISGAYGADRVNEPETSEYSDKQPLVASAPRAVQTTSWKGCCGILELFSSSDRN